MDNLENDLSLPSLDSNETFDTNNDANSSESSGTLSQNNAISEIQETIKKFVFKSKATTDPVVSTRIRRIRSTDSEEDFIDTLEVTIPERMQASYGLYVWPCAPVLAWYLFEHRQFLSGKKILELGAGTSLPGITAALCGAKVTLSDSAKYPHCLEQCKKAIEANHLDGLVDVVGLTWGYFLHKLTKFKGKLDIIIGSDCFYDPVGFEELLVTVAYLLEHNPEAKFLCTYQERSADWSIETLLPKWNLNCKHVPLIDIASSSQVDLFTLMQGHTIHLFEITYRS